MIEAGRTDRLADVFELVERWPVEGDATVRGATAVRLPDDLQNGLLYRATRPADILAWLRPSSARAWSDLEAVRAGGAPRAPDGNELPLSHRPRELKGIGPETRKARRRRRASKSEDRVWS